MWIVEFVNEKARNEILSLPKNLQARAFKMMQMLEIYGNTIGEPHTKNIGDDLFEIRIKSTEGIARSIYCYEVSKKIVILLTFIKKSEKIPKYIVEQAKQRLKEYKNARD